MSLERLFTFECTVPLKEEDDEGRGTAGVTGRDADTTGVLISPAPQQRKCAHLRFTVPLFFCRSQRREKERGTDEKKKTEQNQQNKKNKKAMCERDGRPAAGGNVE